MLHLIGGVTLSMDGAWFSVDEIGIHRKGNSLMEPPSHSFAYKRLRRTPKDYRLGSARVPGVAIKSTSRVSELLASYRVAYSLKERSG